MTEGLVDVGYPFPPLDTSANQIVLILGRKGEGKSEFARVIFAWWDIDRLVIDMAGDVQPGLDARRISADDLPKRMPDRGEDKAPVKLHYVADPKSPTYRDDLDRAIGVVLYPKERPSLLWIEEIGEVCDTNKTPPNLKLLLMQSRHYHCSALLCGPRPRRIDLLCIGQADRIIIFDVPLRADREHIADNAGIDRDLMEAGYREIKRRGRYWYLMWLATEPDALYLCPPLPPEWRETDVLDDD